MTKFISVDGIDGTGKSTIIQTLSNDLKCRCMTTCEPSNELRNIMKSFQSEKEFKAETTYRDTTLFCEDRIKHCNQLKEIILSKKYDLILSDRYVFSTYAYQLASLKSYLNRKGKKDIEGDLQSLSDLICQFSQNILDCDIYIVLICDVENAIKRISKRSLGVTDRFERKEFLVDVDTFFRNSQIFEEKLHFFDSREHIGSRVKFIDANRTIDLVMEDVKKVIESVL